jgi:glucarate dehydratase
MLKGMQATGGTEERGDRIASIRITPVAFRDQALLNSVGVHEPFAIRAIIEVELRSGLSGLGETYADSAHLSRLSRAAEALVGLDIFDVNALRRRVASSLTGDNQAGGHGMAGMVTGSATLDRVASPFEVAVMDLQGKLTGRPVSDLLGGAVRSSVEYSAYLFYKWAGHPGLDPDRYPAALDPEGIVAQARAILGEYGFRAIKLKGGVLPPDREIDAVRALRSAFPDRPLRLDPNATWTPSTAIRVAQALDCVLEYLEDPTPGIEGMAEVAHSTPMPLATNMCVVAFADIPPAISQRAVQVVLSDHHFWGGFHRSQLLAGICQTFGLGLSMHSNSHLGISLAAMTHLAAATPNLDYACDTHWPWKDPDEDVIVSGVLRFENGSVTVPTTPGLGVELDRNALDRLHHQYLECGIRERDDTGYMRRIDPAFNAAIPRW